MDSLQSPNESSRPQPVSEAPLNKRPWSVTLLALGVLSITVINLIRFVLSIRYWSFLSARAGISPFYLTLTGFIWSATGLVLFWGLWKAKIWAPRLMQAMALTYALYFWLDHIFLMDHPVGGATGAIRALLPVNWQFSAGVTVVSLVYMVWTLGRLKAISYFRLAGSAAQQNQVTDETKDEF